MAPVEVKIWIFSEKTSEFSLKAQWLVDCCVHWLYVLYIDVIDSLLCNFDNVVFFKEDALL